MSRNLSNLTDQQIEGIELTMKGTAGATFSPYLKGHSNFFELLNSELASGHGLDTATIKYTFLFYNINGIKYLLNRCKDAGNCNIITQKNIDALTGQISNNYLAQIQELYNEYNNSNQHNSIRDKRDLDSGVDDGLITNSEQSTKSQPTYNTDCDNTNNCNNTSNNSDNGSWKFITYRNGEGNWQWSPDIEDNTVLTISKDHDKTPPKI